MSSRKSLGVIIPAAGHGTRMGKGRAKQFLDLGGKPVLIHVLNTFVKLEIADQIVVAASQESEAFVERLLRSNKIPSYVNVVVGGRTRQESVSNGLQFLAKERLPEITLVHDAARPFVSPETILEIAKAAQKYGAAIAAVRSKDTIKLVNKRGIIESSPDRNIVWNAQTPQGFRTSLLTEAFRRAMADNFVGTDEASLVERLGYKVRVVPGSYQNIKITTPEDFALGNHFLKTRRSKSRGL